MKLQRKDLLAEHLTAMLAKFQDSSESSIRSCLVHSLSTFPTGRPELIQAGESLAGKPPSNPESRSLLAYACYRGGKYAEAGCCSLRRLWEGAMGRQ